MGNNNKECIKLLSVSAVSNSDSGQAPDFVFNVKKKRLKSRRERGSSTSVYATRSIPTRSTTHSPFCLCGGRSFLLPCGIFLVLCYTLLILCLAYVLQKEVRRIGEITESVVAGNQGVQDDLQKIHSKSRVLEQNQRVLFSNFSSLSAQLDNLPKEIEELKSSVSELQERLEANREIVNVKDLSNSVSQWGSQIKDLNSTVTSLRQQGSSLEENAKVLSNNITSLQTSVNQLASSAQRPAPLAPDVTKTLDSLNGALAQISSNLTETNSTLSKRLQWLQDDQKKDHKLIEGLQDLGQNVTARIKTLEVECAKVDTQNALNISFMSLEDKVIADAQRLKLLEQNMTQLRISSVADSSPLSLVGSSSSLKSASSVFPQSATSDGQSTMQTNITEEEATLVPAG